MPSEQLPITPRPAPVGRRRRSRPIVLRRTVAIVVLLGLALAALAVARPGALELRAPLFAPAHDERPGALGREDGFVAVGASISPFSEAPAVARLQPALRDAVRRAAADARADGIALRVSSGWRSARYQRALYDRALKTYGGAEGARRFVKAPGTSSHVTGSAVDVAPTDADSWLSQHGSAYGLCQVYANEIWHFELATEPGGTCPQMSSDATSG